MCYVWKDIRKDNVKYSYFRHRLCQSILRQIRAFDRLGYTTEITCDLNKIKSADKLILPGVGTAIAAMKNLQDRGLVEVIQNLTQPVLGICLGMQLMCRHSEEGDVDCLGIFDADVHRFCPTKHEDKVPHVGWNTITNTCSALFNGFTKEEFVYFVHSYYVPLNPHTAAQTDYILSYSSALHKDNFYATQFHPEKSGKTGERILSNFLNL